MTLPTEDPKIRQVLARRALAQKIADRLYVLDHGCAPPPDFNPFAFLNQTKTEPQQAQA
ncbi:MAG: hypothetical protein WB607_19100 [Candidatus Acidiferrum sp.]|jgi:hypothetical protein